MAYKCLDCGHIFDGDEIYSWYESHGETMSGCPTCGGDYEEMIQCEICGDEYLEGELCGGVCSNCIDDYRNNFEICYSVSIGETEGVEINALLASLFDPSDIEQILKEYIRNRMGEVDCGAFIDGDPDWFGERLAKEVNKK